MVDDTERPDPRIVFGHGHAPTALTVRWMGPWRCRDDRGEDPIAAILDSRWREWR